MALGAAALLAPAAQADPVAFSGGHVDWGVKQSFREYIEANPADGSVTLSGGAYRKADGAIRFPVDFAGGGSYDADTGSGEITLRGTVRFRSHQTAPGSGDYQLDLTISALRLEVDGNAGALVADVQSKSLDDGEVDVLDDLELATVNLTGAGPAADADRFTWASSPTALTAAGAPVFGGFYGAGDQLDDVSATASYGSPSIPPAAPALTTDPLSPANQNSLRVKGTAPVATTVRLYRGAGCSGAPIATGSAADLADPGLPVAVPDNSTTLFSALALTEDGASDCSASVSYVEATPPPSDDGAPTSPIQTPTPAPTEPRALLVRLRGARVVAATGAVTVAQIRCRRGPCRVVAPKRVRLKIGGRGFWAKVKAPARSSSGATSRLRLKLSSKAVKRLAGRRTALELRIGVVAGGQRQPFTVRTTLKRPPR